MLTFGEEHTFYLAASSVIRGGLTEYVEALLAHGWVWYHDWTAAENWTSPPEALPALAVCDVQAARAAELFVMLSLPVSPGAYLELGARIGGGKVAHVVGGDHFFFNHPLVRKHETWQDFLRHLTTPKDAV